MRDALILLIVLLGCAAALRRPWIGIMLWTWLSIMNPHRFSWGIAYDAPLAAMAAGSTMVGLLFTKDRQTPFKGPPMVWLLLFAVWMTLSWLFGIDPDKDYEQWNKVIKIYLMVFVSMMVLHSRLHIHGLLWISAGSVAILAIKGGIFTIATGGNFRVWGPPGSFIEDNNEMALATVMTIPLLRFMQLQYTRVWVRHGFTMAMLLAAASALGSQSRGAVLAISVMALFLWWRGGSRVLGGIVIAIAAAGLLAFMPASWEARMATIGNYGEDRSALGRISAWWTAWGVAKNYVFGAGFDVARRDLVAIYSPYPDMVHAAHSIYFQILGNHGFIGLILWMGIFITAYRIAGTLRTVDGNGAETLWLRDLGSMCQVSLLGYAVGGAFLSLSYFDLPYNIMAVIVLARVWLLRRSWVDEASVTPRLAALFGMAGSSVRPSVGSAAMSAGRRSASC